MTSDCLLQTIYYQLLEGMNRAYTTETGDRRRGVICCCPITAHLSHITAFDQSVVRSYELTTGALSQYKTALNKTLQLIYEYVIIYNFGITTDEGNRSCCVILCIYSPSNIFLDRLIFVKVVLEFVSATKLLLNY